MCIIGVACVYVSVCMLNMSMYESVYCAEGLHFSAFDHMPMGKYEVLASHVGKQNPQWSHLYVMMAKTV